MLASGSHNELKTTKEYWKRNRKRCVGRWYHNESLKISIRFTLTTLMATYLHPTNPEPALVSASDRVLSKARPPFAKPAALRAQLASTHERPSPHVYVQCGRRRHPKQHCASRVQRKASRQRTGYFPVSSLLRSRSHRRRLASLAAVAASGRDKPGGERSLCQASSRCSLPTSFATASCCALCWAFFSCWRRRRRRCLAAFPSLAHTCLASCDKFRQVSLGMWCCREPPLPLRDGSSTSPLA